MPKPDKPPGKRTKRPTMPCVHCMTALCEVERTMTEGELVMRIRRCLTCKKTFPTWESSHPPATGSTELATGVRNLLEALESSPLALIRKGQ
jgi:hypothetical protein